VPVSAESLRFRTSAFPWFSLLKVQLGGQDLTFVPLASGTNFTLFGADIRAWQGQVARLDFTAIAERPHVNNHYLFLDSIVFSTQPIPEPGVRGFAWAWSVVLRLAVIQQIEIVKLSVLSCRCGLSLALSIAASAQGAFQNLNFESPVFHPTDSRAGRAGFDCVGGLGPRPKGDLQASNFSVRSRSREPLNTALLCRRVAKAKSGDISPHSEVTSSP